METRITIDSVLTAILESAKGRYAIDLNDPIGRNLRELAPATFVKEVVRLNRVSSNADGRRTLLVAILEHSDLLPSALSWSSSCKQELLDPESADLYLIICFVASNLTMEECISYEANEKICRKWILRPNESIKSLIDRTFLAEITEKIGEEQLTDPLTVALRDTAVHIPSFDDEKQAMWRRLLARGVTASQL